MDLNLVQIGLEVSADASELLLPHLYDALRRFDACFKAVSCFHGDLQCGLCKENRESCLYRSVFGQELSTDPDLVRRHQKPPLPFAFKISKIATDSSCYELNIVIAGSAIQHTSVFLAAIDLMIASMAAHNGVNISVSGRWCLDYQGGRNKFDILSHDLVLLSGLEILRASRHSDAARICVDSPLRLLYAGTIAHSFDFGSLLRSQLRRCSSLFAYYGEGELDLDYMFMSGAAERVVCLASDFGFRKPQWTRRPGLAGVLGTGEFSGLADGMLPLLTLGSYFNAGKGASFGMGTYRVEDM